jgi:hypothetical protein
MDQAHLQSVSFPEPEFTPWIPWSVLDEVHPPEIGSKLAQVGCYLLGRLDGTPTAEAADPADSRVFYIGETHGNTTSLRWRLQQFGRSAGFYGDQRDGHYAAWRYPDLFPMDRISDAPGRSEPTSCSSARVFFAVCPWQPALQREARGIFPTLIEQQALWRHVAARRALPLLNNSGRAASRQVPPCPEFSDAILSTVLNPATANRTMACAEVLDAIADAAGYSRRGSARPVAWQSWTGCLRSAGPDQHYLGWHAGDPLGVTLHRYRGRHAEFGSDEPPAHTPDGLRALIATFWANWWGA